MGLSKQDAQLGAPLVMLHTLLSTRLWGDLLVAQSFFSQARYEAALSLLGALLGALMLALMAGTQARAADTAFVINIEGAIGPALEDHVARGFEEANATGAEMIILRIDTPGGLVSSTRGIIKTILASDLPVIGFVAPSGSRAASAGAYILLSTHVAVMAPGTNVGSATPVAIGGAPTSPGGTQPAEDDDTPDLTDKILNDAKAYMRALAEMRGRPTAPAEEFVSEAKNVTAEEALEAGLIDLIATNMRDMLNKLDGRAITMGEGERVLETSILDMQEFESTWRDELLGFITDPNIAYLLLIIGIYGLVIEFSNPGLLAPGIVGGVCLILGMYAFQLLPVNYAGLALMALGIILMTTEAFVPSFGILGIGGIASFLMGSIMLFDNDVPELKISPVLIGTVSVTTAALFLFVLTFAVRAWRRPAVSGMEGMIGDSARVLSWRGKRGRVMAHGEVWQAAGEGALKKGDHVEIREINGLTLTVKAEDGPQPEGKTDD